MFTSFKDVKLRNSRSMLDLIDCIQPGSIGYDMVYSGDTDKALSLFLSLSLSLTLSFSLFSSQYFSINYYYYLSVKVSDILFKLTYLSFYTALNAGQRNLARHNVPQDSIATN